MSFGGPLASLLQSTPEAHHSRPSDASFELTELGKTLTGLEALSPNSFLNP